MRPISVLRRPHRPQEIEMDRSDQNTQRACGAGGSIKPRVERSGTLGRAVIFLRARETGDSRSIHLSTLPPATRAGRIIKYCFPGFRFAPPWALCCRLLRRLVERKALISAIVT